MMTAAFQNHHVVQFLTRSLSRLRMWAMGTLRLGTLYALMRSSEQEGAESDASVCQKFVNKVRWDKHHKRSLHRSHG